MSEENTTQNPGLTLPDDAAPVSSVSATDRLLAFNQAGDPVTTTAEKVKEFANEGMATTEAMNTALAAKAALVPFSLAEQPVPGEFWDGKQVYIRSFKGTMPESGDVNLITGVGEACLVRGTIDSTTNDIVPCAFIVTDKETGFYDYTWNWFITSHVLIISRAGVNLRGHAYNFTFKYTKD